MYAIAIAICSLSIALAGALAPTIMGTRGDPDATRAAARSNSTLVADRIDQCSLDARRGGPRPADRLEHDIRACVDDRSS